MRKIHKHISLIIFIIVGLISCKFNFSVTEAVSQNLTTFFSVVFGFYITGLAIIYSAKFSKSLYDEIDPFQPTKRKIHTLKQYFKISGYWALFSIVSVIVYTLFAKKDVDGTLVIPISNLIIPFVDFQLNSGLLLSSLVFSISSINVFLMILLLNQMIDGMVLEAKNHD